jgi:hypothetical protein
MGRTKKIRQKTQGLPPRFGQDKIRFLSLRCCHDAMTVELLIIPITISLCRATCRTPKHRGPSRNHSSIPSSRNNQFSMLQAAHEKGTPTDDDKGGVCSHHFCHVESLLKFQQRSPEHGSAENPTNTLSLSLRETHGRSCWRHY